MFAENAEKALLLIQEHNVHLFLIDVLLPKMNGVEFAASLRKKPQYANTPIVAMSAFGSCVYLVKPVGIQELRQAISDCLVQ